MTHDSTNSNEPVPQSDGTNSDLSGIPQLTPTNEVQLYNFLQSVCKYFGTERSKRTIQANCA